MLKNKIQSDVALILLNGFAIVGIPLLVFCYSIETLFTGNDIPHKSDAEMIANFQTHKAEFQTLLEMIKADKGLKRVDDTWTDPEKPETIGVTPARIAEYKELFRVVGTPRGFYSYLPHSVLFVGSSQGLAVSGSSKSYVIFFEGKPENVVEDIDEYRKIKASDTPEPKHKYPAYRHIEENWYLEFYAD